MSELKGNQSNNNEAREQTLLNRKVNAMKLVKSNCLAAGVVALSLLSSVLTTRADRTPTVPDGLSVGDTNHVEFHAYAVGVQIYSWNAATAKWVFIEPEAVLYDSEGNIVGMHYVGPTWETVSGSKVVAAKVAGITVDTNAIPWLLLKAKTAEGPGVLANTTYVQRLNTAGGIAPATAGTSDGQLARVPYTAEYYFYRAEAN